MATSNESGDTNIRDIIETHAQLALTYQQIMRVIQRQTFFFCLQRQAQPAENTKRPHVVVSILWTFLVLFEILYSSRVRTDKAYIIRPFVKYFLESHIRRQYQRLHDIYLSEVTAGRAQNQDADVERLRQIASEIDDYSKTLSPHRKGLVSKLIVILTSIGTILGLFGVNIPLPQFLFQVAFVEPILRWLIAGHILIALGLSPLILGFLLKRSMFENSITQQIQNYIFIGGPESELFPRSVYLLENRLYGLLGGSEQKPKEVPIDVLMRIGFGLFFVALSLTLSMLTIYGYLQPASPDNNNQSTTIDDTLWPVTFTGLVYVAYPIMSYIQRRKSRLL